MTLITKQHINKKRQKKETQKKSPPPRPQLSGISKRNDGTISEFTGSSKFARGLPEIVRIWAEYSGSGLDLNQIPRFSCFCLSYISGFLNFWISVSRFLDFGCCAAAAAVLCLRGCCSCCCCCCCCCCCASLPGCHDSLNAPQSLALGFQLLDEGVKHRDLLELLDQVLEVNISLCYWNALMQGWQLFTTSTMQQRNRWDSGNSI